MNYTDEALLNFLNDVDSGKRKIQDIHKYIQNAESSTALLGATLKSAASNMAIAFISSFIISSIVKFVQANEKAAESARVAASSYKEKSAAIDSYTSRYQDLHTALLQAKGNEEETYNIKKQLLDLQTELNDQFGDEYGKVNLVTDAYRDQTEVLKAYNKEAARELLNSTDPKGIERIRSSMEDVNSYRITDPIHRNSEEGIFLQDLVKKYSGSGMQIIDESAYGDAFSIRLDANVTDANKTISDFMEDVRAQAEAIDNENLFDSVLSYSSSIFNKTKQVITENGDTWRTLQLADIYTKDDLSAQYEEALQAVEDYNAAVLKSENPVNDKAVKSAYENLILQKEALAKDTDTSWDGYRLVIQDLFSSTDTSLSDFKALIAQNKDGIGDLTEQLRGIPELKLAELSSDLENGDAFDQLAERARNAGINTDQLIAILRMLGIVVEDLPSKTQNAVSKTSFFPVSKEEIDQYQNSLSSINDLIGKINTVSADGNDLIDMIQAVEELNMGEGFNIEEFWDSHTTDGVTDYTSALQDLRKTLIQNFEATLRASGAADAMIAVFRKANDPVEQLNASVEKAEQITQDYEFVQTAVRKNTALSAAEVTELTGRYPDLANHIRITANGWYLEKGAMDIVSAASVSLRNTYLSAMSAMTSGVSASARARLLSLGIELEGISSVADAYNAIYAADKGNKSLYGGLSDADRNALVAMGKARESIAKINSLISAIPSGGSGSSSGSSSAKSNPNEDKLAALEAKLEITSNLDRRRKILDEINTLQKKSYDWEKKQADSSSERLKLEYEKKKAIAENARTQQESDRDYYDKRITNAVNRQNKIAAQISLAEARGTQLDSAFYQEQIRVEEEYTQKHLRSQKQAVQADLDRAVAQGKIIKYSAAWYEMRDVIYEVDEAIIQSQTAVANFQKQIEQLKWDTFDRLIDRLQDVTDESNFLINLLSSSELLDTEGKYTEAGLSVLGLHGINYDTYYQQSEELKRELANLDSQYAGDQYNQNYLTRRQELLHSIRESIKAAEEEKQAMIDLAQEGIQAQIDVLSDYIDKKKESLEAEKAAYEWQKTVEEKTNDIVRLQQKIQVLQGDDSQEAQKKLRELKAQLKSAQDDLADSERDHSYDMQNDELDRQLENFTQQMEQYSQNTEQLFQDTLALINAESQVIGNTLSHIASNAGYDISSSISSAWNGASSAVTAYHRTFSDISASILTSLSQIKQSWNEAAKSALEYASATVALTGQENKGGTNDILQSASAYIKQYADPYDGDPAELSGLNKYIYKKTGGKSLDREFMSGLAAVLGLGTNMKDFSSTSFGRENKKLLLETLKKIGYSTGGIITHAIHDNGDTGWITVRKGETVLTDEFTKLLPESVSAMKAFGNLSDINRLHQLPEAYSALSAGNRIEKIELNLSLPNVTDTDSFVSELQRNQRFEKMIKTIAWGEVTGRTRYDKFKI